MPSGLLSIAAVLRENGYRALVHNADFDGSLERRTGKRAAGTLSRCRRPGAAGRCADEGVVWDSVRRVVAAYRPRVVGVSFTTAGLDAAFKVARLVKDVDETTLVIAGGIHPTAEPEETLSSPDFDIAVRGEGEYTTLEVIRAWEQGKKWRDVAGIAYRDEGRVVRTGPRARIDDLDRIPIDYRELLLDIDLYPRDALGHIWTSRGCPFKCAYCSSAIIWGGEVRFRSPGHVVDEIALVYDRYRARAFRFIDDNFTFDPRRVAEICGLILDRGLRLSWTCCSRADLAAGFPADVLRLMRRSGCDHICIGFESGSQRILDSVGRGLSLEDMDRTLREMRRAGIGIHADFIIGMPGETAGSLAETLELMRQVARGARATLSIARFHPYPGTPLSGGAPSGTGEPSRADTEEPLLPDEEIDRWFEEARRYAEDHNVRLLSRSPSYVWKRLCECIGSPREMAGLVSTVVRSHRGRSRHPAGP